MRKVFHRKYALYTGHRDPQSPIIVLKHSHQCSHDHVQEALLCVMKGANAKRQAAAAKFDFTSVQSV